MHNQSKSSIIEKNSTNQTQLQLTKIQDKTSTQSLSNFLTELKVTIEKIKRTIANIDETYRFIFTFTDAKVAKTKRDLIRWLNELTIPNKDCAISELGIFVGELKSFNKSLQLSMDENSKFSCLHEYHLSTNRYTISLKEYMETKLHRKEEHIETILNIADDSLQKQQKLQSLNANLLALHDNPTHISTILQENDTLSDKVSSLVLQKNNLEDSHNVLLLKFDKMKSQLKKSNQDKERYKSQMLKEKENNDYLKKENENIKKEIKKLKAEINDLANPKPHENFQASKKESYSNYSTHNAISSNLTNQQYNFDYCTSSDDYSPSPSPSNHTPSNHQNVHGLSIFDDARIRDNGTSRIQQSLYTQPDNKY
jgi:hypothetical protein